jgi:hypothetical protein
MRALRPHALRGVHSCCIRQGIRRASRELLLETVEHADDWWSDVVTKSLVVEVDVVGDETFARMHGSGRRLMCLRQEQTARDQSWARTA